MPRSQQPTDKDNTMTYGASYALVTILLIWLDFHDLPLNTLFDTAAQGVCSMILLSACLTLLLLSLDALGKTMLPRDHDKGTDWTCIGAMLSMHVCIIIAIFSHWLDKKTLAFQIFWIQILALPGAYFTTNFLGEMINGKEQWLWIFGMYRLVN
jgi:hypothetical protein